MRQEEEEDEEEEEEAEEEEAASYRKGTQAQLFCIGLKSPTGAKVCCARMRGQEDAIDELPWA